MTKPTKPTAVDGPTLDDAANPQVFSEKTFDWVEYTPLAVQYMADSNDYVEGVAATVDADATAVETARQQVVALEATTESHKDAAETAETNAETFAAAAQAAAGVPSLAGQAGKFLAVKSDETGPEWILSPAKQVVSYVDTFTSSGTWTKRPGAFAVEVWAVGGGASGAKGTNSGFFAGGGGEGVIKSFPATTLGATETVTVASGGAPRTTIGSGTNGGDSSFGIHLTARGGKNDGYGGGGQKPSSEAGDFTSGGYSSGAGARYWSTGGFAPQTGGNTVIGGAGGAAPQGSPGVSTLGGDGGVGGNTTSGGDGSVPGGGGGITWSGTQSGAGGDGAVYVTTYCLEDV